MKNPVSITSVGTISPLGSSPEEIWNNYKTEEHFFKECNFDGATSLAGFLPENLQEEAERLREGNSKYRNLDRSVLYAIMAARQIVSEVKIPSGTGINIGSSRGATGLFEKYHSEYLKSGKTSTYASPSTTLGNISSWVAQDLQLNGPEFSHSVTCSTGMHSVLNAIAWIRSGMADAFIAGGSEAPLTGFTLSQMKAMKIYALENKEYPCRSLDMRKLKNTMILGEGAGVVLLQNEPTEDCLAFIKGIGFANEKLKHGASLSKD